MPCCHNSASIADYFNLFPNPHTGLHAILTMDQPAGSVHARSGDDARRADSSSQPLDCPARAVIILFSALVIAAIVLSGKPLVFLAATVTFVIPAFLAGYFLTRKIGDETLSKSFVFHQLFCGGFVAYIFAYIVETLFTTCGMLLLFWSDIQRLPEYFPADSAANMSMDQMKKAFLAFLASIALWKKILAPVFMAFLVAATVEEVFKFLVGRRVKSRVGISARTFVAGVMSGALGIAATEHFTYTFAMFAHSSLGIACFSSLFRAALAFPLHLGSAMLFGIAMAERNIKDEESSVFKTLLLAILFHGTWDSTLMLNAVLIASAVLPKWSKFVVLGFNIVLLAVLMWLCRKRFTKMMTNADYIALDGEAAV